MVKSSIALAALLISSSIALSQPMTREQTYDELSKRIGEIHNSLKQSVPMNSATGDDVHARIKDAIAKIEALRAYFADNRYVKISGFSVGLPAGVSINVDFK